MASQRLNNGLRAQIINKLIERTFPKRYKEIDKDLGVWLVQYHQLWHSGFEAVLDQLPDRAAKLVMQIRVRPPGPSAYNEAVSCTSDYSLKSFHDFPDGYEYQNTLESRLIKLLGKTKKTEQCLATLHELLKNRKALDAERDKLRGDALAILNSVQTYKALIAVWPEIVEVIGTDEAPKPQRALVKNLGALNVGFGLIKPLQPLTKAKGK